MTTVFLIISILSALGIVAIDVSMAFFRSVAATWCNAALYSVLIISLFLSGAQLITVAVAIMAGAFLLLLMNFIRGRRDRDDV